MKDQRAARRATLRRMRISHGLAQQSQLWSRLALMFNKRAAVAVQPGDELRLRPDLATFGAAIACETGRAPGVVPRASPA